MAHSKDFLEKKELLEIEGKMNERKHTLRMEQLNMEKAIAVFKHDSEMAEINLKTANMRRLQEEKERISRRKGV